MKIFTAAQIKECDAFTINQEAISSLELMERAATACFRWIRDKYPVSTPVLVVCGMGNNGGDGLALTRLLLTHGYPARAVVLRHAEKFSPDAAANLTRLHDSYAEQLKILEPGMFITEIADDILVVDALFGIGLNRPPEGWVADFIREINEISNEKIAIDIPSGLPADNLPNSDSAVVRADYTLTFEFIKRSQLHEETAAACGTIHTLPIGLSPDFVNATHTRCQTIDQADIITMFRPRKRFAHKGTYGKAVIVGGSYGKMGAVLLALQAALRSGAGLVTALAPECGNYILQTAQPEAMFVSAGETFVSKINLPDAAAVAGIGPGLGTDPATAAALFQFLEQCKKPVVLDADALNILALHPEQLGILPPGCVLTPHRREFERLFGPANDSMLLAELARAKAMKYNVHIVLKGHHTAVLMPSGACWYNMTGNPGMATGGSGDVLTGLITGLMAQGYTSSEAALMGVYLHGRAGDLAASAGSAESLIAGDICDFLGAAFKELTEIKN